MKVATELSPETEAVTLRLPEVVPAMSSGLVAWPDSSVCSLTLAPPPTKEALAPELPAVTAKVTVAPGTGSPELSVTLATKGSGKLEPGPADWALPETAETELATPTVVLVKLKSASKAPTRATTLKLPLTSLAVRVGAVASPEEEVATVAVVTAPAKVPLAPVEGAVKVTSTLGTGQPAVSTTSAVRDCI